MGSLKPNELRKAMETIIRELRETELCKDAPLAADKRLAEILICFIEDKFAEYEKKLDEKVDAAVVAIAEKVVALPEFKALIPDVLISHGIPNLVISAAKAAITKVPLSRILDVPDNAFGDMEHLSPLTVAELLHDVSKASMKVVKIMDTFVEKHNTLLTAHNNLASDFAAIMNLLKPIKEVGELADEYVVSPEGMVFKKQSISLEELLKTAQVAEQEKCTSSGRSSPDSDKLPGLVPASPDTSPDSSPPPPPRPTKPVPDFGKEKGKEKEKKGLKKGFLVSK